MRFIKALFFIYFLLPVSLSAVAEEVLLSTWHGKPSSSEQSFMKRLKELHPSVQFTIITANRNKKTLAQKLRRLDLSNTKLIYAAGTNNSTMVQSFVKNKIPMLFYYVSDPVGSKLVKSDEKPGNNITGARFLVKPELQVAIMAKMKKLNKVAIWYDPREKSGILTLEKVEKKMRELGITPLPVRIIPDAITIDKQLKKAAAQAETLDAVYLIPSYSFYVNLKKIFSTISPSVFTVSSIAAYSKAGSTIAIGSNPTERVNKVAEMGRQILLGKQANQLPVSTVSEDDAFLYINKKRLQAAGLGNIEKLGLAVKYVEEE